MRFLALLNPFFFTFALCILNFNLYAQDQNCSVNQDPKFEQLLNEKLKINASLTVNDRYKIQIFSGESEKAKKTLFDFKQEYTNMNGTMIFNTPNYKVWVGNFRTRIEAERNLIEIRKKYKNALLIKPSK